MLFLIVNGKVMAQQLQPLLLLSPPCVRDSSTVWAPGPGGRADLHPNVSALRSHLLVQMGFSSCLAGLVQHLPGAGGQKAERARRKTQCSQLVLHQAGAGRDFCTSKK